MLIVKKIYDNFLTAKIFSITTVAKLNYIQWGVFLMTVLELNDDAFEKSIVDSKPMVLDFYSPTCGPCKALAPILESMSEMYSEKVTFAKINVETNQRFLEKYEIMNVPTIIIFKDGNVLKKVVGLHDEDKLLELLQSESLL